MRKKIKYLGILFLISISYVKAQERLYVFFPSTTRPQVVQEKMQNSFNDVNVTVFGRLNDFTAKIEIVPPDAILTRTSLVKQLGNYEIAIQGVRGGKTEETYILLSMNSQIDLNSIGTETVIGVIDILGRMGMNTFVSNLLPILPKLKRVTKLEDLLPLLSFNMASAILIEEPAVDYFKTTSNLNFSVTQLPGTKEGIVALGIKKDAKVVNCIINLKKSDKEISSFFEVDSWK